MRGKDERRAFEESILARKFDNFQVKRGVMSLSIIPFEPTEARLNFSSWDEERIYDSLMPSISQHLICERYPHAIAVASDRNDPEFITKLTDRGSIFSAQNWIENPPNGGPQAQWYPRPIWRYFVADVQRYLRTLNALKVPDPWTIGLTIQICQNTVGMVDHASVLGLGRIRPRPYIDPSMELDSIEVNSTLNIEDDNAIRAALFPIYRDIWMNYGYPGAPKYSNDHLTGFE